MSRTSSSQSTSGCGRDRLLAAGLKLFAAKGYAAASVRDIVRAAGVTAPALYHHFGSKEGLFLALAREGKEKIEAARRAALDDGGSVSARIARLARAHAGVRRQYADLAWVVEQILTGPPEVAPSFDFRAVAFESLHLFETLVGEGVASGEFRRCAPRPAALAILGAIEIASRPHVWDKDGNRSAEQLDGMLDVLFCGLAARTA